MKEKIYKRIEEVCEFISGYTPSKDILLSSGNLPYFKVADMNTMGNELYLVKTSYYLNNPKKIIPKGSIVFPKNGGAIFTNKKRILYQDSVVDLNTEALYPNEKLVSVKYLYWLLSNIDLGQFDNGGGLPSLNIKRMKEYKIPIPSLEEQQIIVNKLDALSEKVNQLQENYKQTLVLCSGLKQALLKQIFE